jgi:hypothetical protein
MDDLASLTVAELFSAVRNLNAQNAELRKGMGEPFERRWSASAVEKDNARLREENERLRSENETLIAKLSQSNQVLSKVRSHLDELQTKEPAS